MRAFFQLSDIKNKSGGPNMEQQQQKEILLPGGLLSTKSYVDVPAGPQKSEYLYTNLLPNISPINIPFWKKSTKFWSNWVLFTIIRLD